MRPTTAALACAALLLGGCLGVIIEASEDDAGEDSETGDGDGDPTGDGDPGTGDGDGDPGTGDGDGDPGTGDGDGDPQPDSFRVVVLADPHIPGPGYTGDDQSILAARDRLIHARDKIAIIDPPPTFVVVLGDHVHEAYAGKDLVWYQTNDNAFADVADIYDSFPVPVYVAFGESDYAVPEFTKQFSHLLFGQFFATDPYWSVDYLGWRFVFANSEYGQTFDEGTQIYDTSQGSYGATQLSWLAEQLGAGMPTVLFTHFPLFETYEEETQNAPYPDVQTLLEQEGDSVAVVLSGHDHEWSNLPATYAAPHIVFGATRYDSDNFLLIEFTANALQYDILDLGKVEWGGQGAETWIYDGEPMPGG